MNQQYSSTLLERAVDEFSKLPGIGRKTALRLMLHLLKREETEVDAMAESIVRLRHEVKHCKVCHNISDDEICAICANKMRDDSIICVVENFQDVLAIEATTQFHGLYHVLGGVISPMDGISPADLEIQSLVDRVGKGGVEEVILALSSTMEGDTTNFVISRRLEAFPDLKLTVLARGISINDELQYTDEVTLGRSIVNRTPFKAS
ncbi:MAG: recombination protein RecR [Bacteroidaceae bacterium]|nr:recombination protein RecR [Bacteroidaceae bacterium]